VIDSIAAAVSSTPVLTVGTGNSNSTFSGVIQNTSGTVSLVSTGTDTTVLTGNSTFGGTTTIATGNTLQIGNGAATGSIGAGNVLDSGALVLNRTDSTTFANVVSLTGSVTQAGTGTVTFTGSNTYTGGTTISAGAVRPGLSNALGTGVLTDNSLLDLNGVSLTVGGLAGTGTVDDVSGSLAPVLTVGTAGTTTTFSGVIQNTTGVVTLVNAAGTLVLTGNNTYGTSGQINTTISAGNLQLGAGGTSGSVTGNIANASVLTINRSDVAVSVSNNISGLGSVALTGTGTVTFTGSNTYTGLTTITKGTLVLPSTAALASGNQIVDSSALQINAGTSASPLVLGSAGKPAITGGGALTVGLVGTPGYVQLAAGNGANTIGSLTINTGSSLDITKNNTLTINYGAATDPVFTIRGYLKSAYNGSAWTGTGLTSSSVKAEVANAQIHGGGLYDIGYVDGSDPSQTLAVGHQLIYKPTIAGDANLDGSVNFLDLTAVAQNLGSTVGDWEKGDFNYDGSVNFLDLTIVAQNLNKTTVNTPLGDLIADPSPSLVADWNLMVAELGATSTQPTDLPEPGMISLLAVGAGGLLARRRRKA
jgi:autotransporter-associated beta strand protein